MQVRCGLHDPWATLGVPHNASEKEVKKAHRQLVKQHHPDVKAADPLAHARFIRIQVRQACLPLAASGMPDALAWLHVPVLQLLQLSLVQQTAPQPAAVAMSQPC